MLHFSQFEKSYLDHLVLKIDNIMLPEGIFWLKGSNGSGKSTLLKAIAGILSFKGDIAIGKIYLKTHGVSYRRLVSFGCLIAMNMQNVVISSGPDGYRVQRSREIC